MFSQKFRHWMVAASLVAATVTVASAAGFHRAPKAALPVPAGDLGEVVVYAPHDLAEVIVRAPRDYGEVLVEASELPAPGRYLAEVVVFAPRDVDALYINTTEAAATLASAD